MEKLGAIGVFPELIWVVDMHAMPRRLTVCVFTYDSQAVLDQLECKKPCGSQLFADL
jgi:hypothetical protein